MRNKTDVLVVAMVAVAARLGVCARATSAFTASVAYSIAQLGADLYHAWRLRALREMVGLVEKLCS